MTGAEVQRTALAPAQRLSDTKAQARVLRASGGLCLRLASHEQARDHFWQALRLYEEVGDPAGQARADGSLSMTFAVEGRYRETLGHSEQAMELSRSSEDPFMCATMLNKVGWHLAHLGEHKRALDYCEQSLGLFPEYRQPSCSLWMEQPRLNPAPPQKSRSVRRLRQARHRLVP